MEKSNSNPKRLTIESVLGPIVRKDNDFQVKLDPKLKRPVPRIGGSSFSSGVFIEKISKSEWIGKADVRVKPNDLFQI